MNVVFQNKANHIQYCDLNFGDVFVYNTNVFMMTDQKVENTLYDEYKAINLASGEMERFKSNVIVNKVECELIIQE